MTSSGTDFSALWAKTASSGAWHSLPLHLLDVAACADALLRYTHESIPIIDRSLLIFLAATHDVGKANRYFQRKDAVQAQRLADLGFDLGSLEEQVRHGQATGAYLAPWLSDRWGWPSFEAECVAKAVGGHHGTFFCDCSAFTLGVHQEPWKTIGAQLIDEIASVIGVLQPIPVPQPLNPFLGWLAGFVSVADWLGSHEEMTVWQEGQHDLATYFDDACHRARRLLNELGWSPNLTTPALTLENLLPQSAKAKPLQTMAQSVADDFTLAIVEAPTGEGKTEAAFALSEAARSKGAGVYYALPTMATANGLHGRVGAYLKRAGGTDDIEARLLHSNAWLFRNRVNTARNPRDEGDEQEEQAQDWFAGSKRGLLTPYGVGTIDQVLVAALRAKHGFVRLFALTGKVVVIDEVHAYDVYMGDLLEVLLGWLRALGCKVVMLSATLPKARREAMLRAWGCAGKIPESTYPSITWVTRAGTTESQTVDVTARKPLTLTPLQVGDRPIWQTGADEILARVQESGGLGALILNTVSDAQAAFDHLAHQDLGNIALDLFHARFTAHDRDRIEGHVLREYGKHASRTGPRVLVATQVVEQSLDLDFDRMVTALAPIDLLIQRAGRLHRHVRGADGQLRAEGADMRTDPELLVLVPDSTEATAPEIIDPVYSRAVLLRTAHLLKSPVVISESAQVSRAIEEVYSEAGRAAVAAEWTTRLNELEVTAATIDARQHREADRATIGRVDDLDNLIVEADLDLDENDERAGSQLNARTRLEDRPSVTVALLSDPDTTIHGQPTSDLRAGLFAGVRCSPPYQLWKSLIQIERLTAWRRKGSLAQARPLILTAGRVQVGEYEISYDPARGLQWRELNA